MTQNCNKWMKNDHSELHNDYKEAQNDDRGSQDRALLSLCLGHLSVYFEVTNNNFLFILCDAGRYNVVCLAFIYYTASTMQLSIIIKFSLLLPRRASVVTQFYQYYKFPPKKYVFESGDSTMSNPTSIRDWKSNIQSESCGSNGSSRSIRWICCKLSNKTS